MAAAEPTVSMADLDTAFELIDAAGDRCFFAGPREPALIDAAEEALGRRLPPTYRAFVQRFGVGDVDGVEI
jgi:antitoxin YobK